MKSNLRINCRNRGLTLVEVLLAIAMTALIMGAILGTLVNVLVSAKKTEELNSTQKVGHAILSIIQKDLQSVFLPSDAKTENNEKAYFRVSDGGDFDQMDFISVVQSSPNEDGRRYPISETGYRSVENTYAQNEEGLYVIFRREDLWSDDTNPLMGGVFEEIYDRVIRFNILCYDGLEWLEYWDWFEMEKRLPLAVKIELELRVDSTDTSILTEKEIERIQRQSSFTMVINLPLGEKVPDEEPESSGR